MFDHRIIALIVALIVASGLLVPAAAEEIHWSVTGPSSITLNWNSGPNATAVSYGTSPGSYTHIATAIAATPLTEIRSGPQYEVELRDLLQDTRYYYRIGNGPEGSFRTPPLAGESGFTVMAQGDIGTSTIHPQMFGVQQLIADQAADLVLALGDLTYADTYGLEQIAQHFDDVTVWSRNAAYMPIWGNHDWDDDGIDDMRNYKWRFALPNQQASPGAPLEACCGEDWYWFDYGNVRFIAYPEPFSGAWADWNERAGQLMAAAQLDTKLDFIVTFGHRPAYSSGLHSGSTTLAGYLDALGATHNKYQLNLNGHSHNYERSKPQNGVVHVTVGTGGSALQNDADSSCSWRECPAPAWSAYRALHHGALRLRFEAGLISASFLCGPADPALNDVTCNSGAVLDSFTLTAPNSASGDSLSFVAAADATLKIESPTANFGTSSQLQVDASPQEAFVLRFLVSGIDGAEVATAKLRLHAINPSDQGGDIYAVLDSSWAETTVNWNNRPEIGAQLASIGPVVAGNWYEIDVSSLVSGDGSFDFYLDSSSSNGADFASRETGQLAPQLIIQLAAPSMFRHSFEIATDAVVRD